MDFAEWAARADTLKLYLVETAAVKIADGSLTPLYLSTHPLATAEKYFIPCVSGLPRLTRQSNDTLTPNHVPTWGELEVNIEPNYCPDPANAIPWKTLLSPAYSFRGQPLTIRLGGEGFAYEDFQTIFTGRVAKADWQDAAATLTLYDKGKDLDNKIPAYELPESAEVLEGSYNQALPIVLGQVSNYKPVLISTGNPGDYPLKYGLAAHLIHAVDMVYYNGWGWVNPGAWIFRQKDLSPAAKNPVQVGEGSATMRATGDYTGAATMAQWLVQIDSITALNEAGQSGPEVGLATFRWSLNKGETWEAEGILTWLLAPGPVTKNPAVGSGVMVLGGAYTGQVKRQYKVKITTGGEVGTAKFKFSDDDGATWSAEILIGDANPIPLSHGLTAAFANGAPPSFEVNDQWSWTFDEKPIPLADGVFVQFFTGPGDDFVLYDEWTFILFSSIMCADTAQAADITVAGRGLISPATGVYPDKAGELIRAVLVGFAGWEAEADFDLPALAAFNAAFPYKMGLVADSPQAIGDIIDSLLTGLPALYTITSNGKFYLAEIKAPSGEAALELTDIEILEPPVGDDLGDLLYRRVYLHYNRNDCTLQNAVAELPQERLEWLRRQWRQVSARDDTILSLYPLAQDLGPLDTAIVERSEALQAARKLLSLYKTGHETLQVLTKIQPFLLDLGKIVKIRRPRFGLDQGDLFLVSGMDQDYAANEAVLTLWR